MSRTLRAGIVSAAFVVLSGCLIGGGTRVVSALELRAAVVGIDLGRVDPRLRNAFETGQIWPGQTEAELYMSRGQPHLWWNTHLGQNACHVLVHHSADPAVADLAVTTCGGRVIGTNQIQPALPCWRLAEVGPRIAAAAAYFDERPLDVQWQIVIGLLHRGQAEQDVMIAFGEPHNRGFEEREDGKRAEKLVFLDHSGDAYGLNITLVDNKVVAWQMPAERVLTAEAQQRRLEAMEKRLTDKIAKVEELAIRQHAETVKLFGDVMAQREVMLAALTRPPAPPPAGGGGGLSGGGGVRPSGPPPNLTGSKTLTINGTTYTDGPNGELGNPCSLAKNTCTSPAYTCVLITSSSGMCAPRR